MPNRPTRDTSSYRARALQLSQRVRQARLNAGMTQQELAQRASVSIGTIRAIETARVVEPGIFTVAAICASLGVSLLAVLGESHKDAVDET